jgi:MATE family multidrug resistance protein
MIGVNIQTRATLKDLLHLAWPVVRARIGIRTMGLTDVIVVGNFSGLELAYSSLALAPIADTIGRRPLILISLGLAAAGMLLGSMSTSALMPCSACSLAAASSA